MILDDIQIQNLADKFTSEVLTAKYGNRFTDIDNVEDDAEMNSDWEMLNGEFYSTIEKVSRL